MRELLVWQVVYWATIIILEKVIDSENFAEVLCQIVIAFGLATIVTKELDA